MTKSNTLFIVLGILPLLVRAQIITGYQKYQGVYPHDQQEFIVLRTFLENNSPSYLIVNPKDLTTSIVHPKSIEVQPTSSELLHSAFGHTPYMTGIQHAETNSKILQDAGLTHTMHKERGVVLTIDLCPSKKPLDRRIFLSLIQEFQKRETPVPIALSVSGLWMNTHQSDLAWLKKLVKKGSIKVDWVNHTYSHPYSSSKELPLQHNFVLEKGVNLQEEILKNEVTMLQNGLVPSVFFRFPGLVSDDSVFQEVISYGLIPVGSDAWLAKGQKPKEGSFVLIHGNGNEPVGVKDFLQLLKQEDADIRNKSWVILDLRDSVE
jgi:hypothetical protein